MKPIFRGVNKSKLKVDFPCRHKSLRRARSVVRKFAQRHGFEADAEDIALATQEALKNIVQYACPVDGSMHITMTDAGDRMVVEVMDRGTGFDPRAIEEGPPSPMALHGRGIQIMRGLMDEVLVESGRGSTVVHMEKMRAR
ncbi:MAG: ATP-binding protein [Actinobacteria bacterium]|nr:ATP-binding protein [Actinomycetota bacterium]